MKIFLSGITSALQNSRFLAIIASISFSILIGCGPDVYATYDGGNVTEKHLNDFDAIFNLGARLENPQMKRKIVKDLAVMEILAKQATDEKIDEAEFARYFLGFAEKNYAREYMNRKKLDDLNMKTAKVYRARHILLKVSADRSSINPNNPNPPVDPVVDQAVFDKITEMREKILSGELKFEDAAVSYSNDPGSSRKQGDLGYFTKGTMDSEFQAAIERLAGESEGTPARVAAAETPVFQETSDQSLVLTTLNQNQIATVAPVEGKADWVKATSGDIRGFMKVVGLKNLEKEGKISYPVRSMYGWHLIEVTFADDVTFNDYVDLVYDKDFKEVENGEERAEALVRQYWDRLKQQQVMDWQKSIREKYGIYAQPMALSPDWQKHDILLKNDVITITSQDYKQFVENIAVMQNMEPSEIFNDAERVNQFYTMFVELSGYGIEAEKTGVYDEKDFQERIELERKRFLAELYRRTVWEKDFNIPESRIRQEYNSIVGASKNRPGSHIPKYDELKSRIKGRIAMTMIQEKENELLTSVNFRYNEDEFPEPPQPPQQSGMPNTPPHSGQ